MSSKLLERKYLFIILGIIFLIDALSKLVINYFFPLEKGRIFFDFLIIGHVRHVVNFGYIQGFILCVCILAPVTVLIFYKNHLDSLARIIAPSIAMVLGGMLGNLLEILYFGYATDWLAIGTTVCNFADIAMVLGVLLLFLGLLIGIPKYYYLKLVR
jgi:lipoprotein signal peptidase